MANLVFNVAKGREAYYGSLPAANDALVAVFIEASGLVDDATMQDYVTLDAILAGTSNEQTTIGRQALTGVTVTINQASDRAEVDAADFTKAGATGNPTGAIVICYDPDTTVGTDADLIPLTKQDYAVTPDGSDLLVTIGGIVNAS